MEFTPATPTDAAALVMLDSTCERVLWAKRNPELSFLGGFHSFPGGKVDAADYECEVRNSPDKDTAALIACVARETFEEVGVLLVRNGERLTKGQLPLLHDDLDSGRETFAEILRHWGLWLDADDFRVSGVWTTPEFSPVRFRTTFFVARCPTKQIPYSAISELLDVEFVEPGYALREWSAGRVLIAPPVVSAMRAAKRAERSQISVEGVAEGFSEEADRRAEGPHVMELNSRFSCFPVRTKTLPPATHTNCYLVGHNRFVVIDAASPFEDEQRRLFELIDEYLESGGECEAIIVSHLHPDHFGGESALRDYLFEKTGQKVPIVAHDITVESLSGKAEFDGPVQESYTLKDRDGKPFELEVLHTPGHARGHLCFYDREIGFLLSSDNVVGAGTVVIAPPEGNMLDYLESLEAMRDLPGLRSLAGSHGAAVSDAKSKIDSYIEHRLQRESEILSVVRSGVDTIEEIVEEVYRGLDPRLIPLASKSVEAHLEKLGAEGNLPGFGRESLV